MAFGYASIGVGFKSRGKGYVAGGVGFLPTSQQGQFVWRSQFVWG